MHFLEKQTDIRVLFSENIIKITWTDKYYFIIFLADMFSCFKFQRVWNSRPLRKLCTLKNKYDLMFGQSHLRSLHIEPEFFMFFFFLHFICTRHPFLSKCLWQMRKCRFFFCFILIFFYDKRKFWRQCENVIDTTWGCIYFVNVYLLYFVFLFLHARFSDENYGLCARTFIQCLWNFRPSNKK